MRIAYVGNFEVVFTTENHVALGLEALGHEVVKLQEDKTPLGVVREQALSSDLLLWTTTWRPNNPPADESIALLQDLEQRGVPTAAYHLDLWHGVSRGGRRWWEEAMFHVKYFFTVDGHMEEWERLGFKNIYRTYPAVSPDATVGRRRREYVAGVAFVGSDGAPGHYHPEWPYRWEMIRHLQKRWGHLYLKNKKTVREQDLNDFYASCGVVVGDSLALEWNKTPYWSDRPYETTGRGGFLVMPQLDELQAQFDGYLPMYPWGDWDALDEIIQYYSNNARMRALVGERCFEITHARHTYTHRMREILEVIFR